MSIEQTIEIVVEKGLEARRDDSDAAVITWRYLRLALVLLAVGLAASVVYERLKVGDCWQLSISAYYYTPVQGFMVGALVAIGICLICLRGASDGEDVLLNLAGICAPFAALVPTPETGSCGSVLTDTANRNANVGNNVVALLIVAWISLAAAAVLSFAGTPDSPRRRPSIVDKVGYGFACVALFVGTCVFVWGRKLFIDHAHNVVAVSLFVFIFLNVCLNGVQRYVVRSKAGQSARRFNRYAVVALAMLVDALVHFFVLRITWAYWLLTLEASLIALFALFWSLQTAERWADGISPEPKATAGPPVVPVAVEQV